MANNKTDLDVDRPDIVSDILRNVAQMYYDTEGELESSWQDASAGRIWSKIAKELEKAADRIDSQLKKTGLYR